MVYFILFFKNKIGKFHITWNFQRFRRGQIRGAHSVPPVDCAHLWSMFPTTYVHFCLIKKKGALLTKRKKEARRAHWICHSYDRNKDFACTELIQEWVGPCMRQLRRMFPLRSEDFLHFPGAEWNCLGYFWGQQKLYKYFPIYYKSQEQSLFLLIILCC